MSAMAKEFVLTLVIENLKLLKEFRRQLKTESFSYVDTVAYWWANSAKTAGVGLNSKVHVVCDGATDAGRLRTPSVIRQLY